MILASGLLFGALAGYMAYVANRNTAATTFYWTISGLGAAFMSATLLVVVQRVWFMRIAYVDIQGISEAKVSGETFLSVKAGRREFALHAVQCEDGASFDAVKGFLISQSPD